MKTDNQPKKILKFDLPDNPEQLLLEILDHYPEEDSITLKKVMSIGKIKYQDVLPGGGKVTAAVVNTKPYTLLYGKKFIEETLEDFDDLVYLNSHELHHLVLDHFAEDILRDFKEYKVKGNSDSVPPNSEEAPEENKNNKYDEGIGYDAMHIIVDCQVNATVYNSLKEEKYVKFVKRYYDKHEMPYCFFRPDGEPLYSGHQVTPKLDASGNPIIDNNGNLKAEVKLVELEDDLKSSLKALHEKLYSETGVTNRELIEGLMPWFEKMENQQDQMEEVMKKLLGNHEDLLRNRTGNSNSEELEELTETVAKNYLNKKKKQQEKRDQCGSRGGEGEGEEKDKAQGKKNKEGDTSESEGGRKAGKGGDLVEQMFQISLEKIEAAKSIRSKLKNPRVMSPSARIYRAINQYSPKTPVRSVVPNFHDRRTSAIYSTGSMPIFHRSNIIGSKVKVPCYLDVSGSQSHMIPVMIPVVGRLKKLVGDVIYCFSTVISETKITTLKSGRIHTTGGTDFSPVLEHIIRNKFKQAVIFTDGEAWAKPELIAKIKKMNIDITVGWTDNEPQLEPMTSIASKTFFIFGDNK